MVYHTVESTSSYQMIPTVSLSSQLSYLTLLRLGEEHCTEGGFIHYTVTTGEVHNVPIHSILT